MYDINGFVQSGRDHITLQGVPIVAPAGSARGGEELLHSLDLQIRRGQHTLITGPKCVSLVRFSGSPLIAQWCWQNGYFTSGS